MVRKDLESVETCCWRNVEAKVVVDGRWFEAEEKGWHISTWAFLKEENRKSRLVARMLSKPFGPPFATGIIGGGGSASATAILRFVSPQRPHNQQQQQQQVRELSPATQEPCPPPMCRRMVSNLPYKIRLNASSSPSIHFVHRIKFYPPLRLLSPLSAISLISKSLDPDSTQSSFFFLPFE